jgi:VanZ family protein
LRDFQRHSWRENGGQLMAPAKALSAEPPQLAPLGEWIPVILWGGLIFTLSTSAFSAANTSKVIDPMLRWLIPGITAASVDVCHMLVRKAAHFTEYGILFWLLVRGPMAQRPWLALMLCVVYALTDEGHQVFVPGRTASLYDVALDSTGALFSHFLTTAIGEIV